MRQSERGSAMLVTLILMSALLAGAAVLAAMQMSSTRSSDVTRTGMSATYCAEAGLAQARAVIAANYTSWAGWLCTASSTSACTEPSSLPTLTAMVPLTSSAPVTTPVTTLCDS